ncbi:leukocyte surface antigen CD53-like [Daphnia pulex]|uniref:leukocyte surface antigen CD53-like n=1 Tax=Daphnia pulex TaxID=6669 RepID=UPI001EDE1DA5|nr:leukocyte surface antigen CD53-like [Daphnia pulex]
MQEKTTAVIKWCAFIINFIIGVIGAVILAASLRILFDNEYSHLLFHGSGNYLAGHVLVVTGISLMIVCLIGCTGIVKGSSCLLGLGFVSLIIFVVVEVTFGVVAYNELAEFHEKVHLGIFWAIQRHYGNDIANTTVIDLIQQGWKCCGLNSYASWSNSLYSKRHTPKGTWPTNKFIVPKSCCIDPQSDLCEVTHLNGIRNFDTPVEHVFFMEGCGPKVIDAINYYVGCLFGFGVVVVSLAMAAMILCGILICNFIKMGHFIRLKSLKSPESTNLIADEQPSGSPKESPIPLPSAPVYALSSRTSLLVSERPISSLV